MFTKKFSKNINFKFLRVISIILFINTFVLSTVIALNEREMLRHSLVTKGQDLASYIAKLSVDPLIMKENIQLDAIVNEANKDEDILYTIIQDMKESIVTSQFASINYRSPRLKAILSDLAKDSELPDIIAAIHKKEAVTKVSVPAMSGNDTVGKVTISLSQHNIHQQIVKTVLYVIALNVIVAFTLGAIFFTVSKRIILTPIAELANAANQLAKGDLSTKVKVKTTGELQMLVDSFNRMAGDLQKTTVSKDYVDNIINSMIDTLLIVISPDGTIVRANTAAFSILDYKEKELIGQPFGMVLEGALLADGFPKDHTSIEKIYIAKGGRKIPVLFSASIMHDRNGTFEGIVCVAQDITERKQADEALRESEEKYRSLVESSEDFIYLVDKNYKYLFMNKKYISRLGLLDDKYLGQECSKFHSPDQTKWFIEKVNKVFTTGESIQHELKSLRDGRYFLQTLSPVKKSDGTVTAVTVISKDIHEIKRMEEKLQALALTDDLTGLYNRRGFFTLVEHLLKMSKRQKKGIFMLYIDLDNLKVINDTFGHQEGDLALIDTTAILKENYRESDIISRIGGDEFVVIPVGTAEDSSEIIFARLQKAVELYNSKSNRRYKLSFSAGIAYFDPEHPCTIDELLIQGDKSMYDQKRHKNKN